MRSRLRLGRRLLAGVWLIAAAPHAHSENYSYDVLGRLVQIQTDDGRTLTYAYDAAGNRVTLASAPTVTAGPVTLNTPYNTSGSATLTPGGAYTGVALGPQPTNGSSSLQGLVATYSPRTGYYGSDSFTYTVTGPGASATGVVSVNVATPSAPTANNVSLSSTYNGSGSTALSASGVYSSFALVTQPSNGSAAISLSTVTYTPNSGYYGSDSFTYKAIGPGGPSSPATVSVAVATPPIPVATPTSLNVAFNTPASVTLPATGVYQSFSIYSNPSHGTVSLNNASATYTPTSGYYGSDSFSFTATGPGGGNDKNCA